MCKKLRSFIYQNVGFSENILSVAGISQRYQCGNYQLQLTEILEQLERLRSEDTPRCLMITHIIESYWIEIREPKNCISCNFQMHVAKISMVA